MPFQIIVLPNKKYSVQNRITGHLFSKGSTLDKAKKQLRLVQAKMSGGTQDKEILYKSMSDEDLHAYFPASRVVKYSEIPRNTPITDFLKSGDVLFLLYEHEKNNGHWCGICRNDRAIYYFDSYGNAPCIPISWNSQEKNQELNQDPNVLNSMLIESSLPVYYNDYDYQSKKEGVSTCGRWVTSWFCFFKKLGGDLLLFKKMIDKETKKTNKSKDELITEAVKI